mmetsp:Transcript_5269/g.7702  ORF Transcript_5269/g.7702 Transcript_5269/m.7702 type:complete len:688 (-) Transcript_5269:351-2414(-)
MMFVEQQQQQQQQEMINELKEEHELSLALLQSQILDLQTQLQQRETQLNNHSTQLTTLTEIHDTEKEQLYQKIRDTKEEAKKRILRAKERVEEMEQKLAQSTKNQISINSNNSGKDEMIAQLRSEGENLMRKQSVLEQAVRASKSEVRELTSELASTEEKYESASEKIKTLTAEMTSLKSELSAAKKGESKSSQLETNLVSAREETQKQIAMSLSLEQEIKELKTSNKELKEEMRQQLSEVTESQKEVLDKVKKEKDERIHDLEMKLQVSEREANMREDALRHEVGELRKRWQDAVRRADALSMDVQQSTAPLMRQLESTDRQNRARAAAWAELETKLRSDLEEYIVQNEKLLKERTEIRVESKRLQRTSTENEEELVNARSTIATLTMEVQNLETKLDEVERESRKMREDWVEVERQASEGAARVRSEMMRTVVDSEDRYRSQMEVLERDLQAERMKREGLEGKLEELAQSTGMMSLTNSIPMGGGRRDPLEKEKKLRSTTDQAAILQGALGDFGDSSDEEDENEDDENMGSAATAAGSFAAMEQLSQGLKGAKLELEALRKQLASSEKTRESLVTELGETRQAAEKLPLFEAKVAELMREVQEKDFEIRGLQDDINDVKLMYRCQLDALLEEKASLTPLTSTAWQSNDPDGANYAAPLKSTPEEDENYSTPSDVAAADFDLVYSG